MSWSANTSARFLALIIWLTLCAGCMDHPTAAGVPATLGVLSEKIELGVVVQGGYESEYFFLMNTTSSNVEIARIESSCSCLNIELSNTLLSAGRNTMAQVHVDFASDDSFVGDLAMEAKGITSTGTVAFILSIHVTVRPASEFGQLSRYAGTDELSDLVPKPMPLQ